MNYSELLTQFEAFEVTLLNLDIGNIYKLPLRCSINTGFWMPLSNIQKQSTQLLPTQAHLENSV